jgi:hypothetical protein
MHPTTSALTPISASATSTLDLQPGPIIGLDDLLGLNSSIGPDSYIPSGARSGRNESSTWPLVVVGTATSRADLGLLLSRTDDDSALYAKFLAVEQSVGRLSPGRFDDPAEGLPRHSHSLRGRLLIEPFQIREPQCLGLVEGQDHRGRVALLETPVRPEAPLGHRGVEDSGHGSVLGIKALLCCHLERRGPGLSEFSCHRGRGSVSRTLGSMSS